MIGCQNWLNNNRFYTCQTSIELLKMIDSSIHQHRIDLSTRVKCSEDAMAADLGGELAILNLKTGIYYGLDEVGGRIWGLLKESRTVREVRDVILQEYAVDDATCERDLMKLLAELDRHKLLQFGHASDQKI